MHTDWTLLPDERPRDFRARIRRRQGIGRAIATRLGGRRPNRARHLAVLLVAVAVPAFAAPDQWPDFAIGNAGRAEIRIEPMPFERAGDSFPGSAFYYLASEQQLGQGIHSDADGAVLADDPVAGPAARAMDAGRNAGDYTRALQCLTAAIYYEAASEPDDGQRAVAQVVLNRVAHPSYPNTVCQVVYEGSERATGCQFSFTCDGSLARRPMALFWRRAQAIAGAALSGYVYAPVGLATHYHTVAVHPVWSDKLAYIGTIGAHRFYRFGGRAGQLATFRFAYAGGEPIPGPHPRSAAPPADPALDPLAIQQAFGGVAAIAAPATSASALQPAADPASAQTLPKSTGIRPEYANSGQWITRPGT